MMPSISQLSMTGIDKCHRLDGASQCLDLAYVIAEVYF